MSGLSYLQDQATAFPDQEEHFTQLSNLYKDRLWFQLTEKLLQLLSVPHFQKAPHLLNLYQEFVKGFEKDLSKLDLAQFAIAASKQCDDFKETMSFLDKVAETMKGNPQADVLCKMEKAELQIKACDNPDELHSSVEANIEEGKSAMDKFEGIMDPVVHSSYYRVKFFFHKKKKQASEVFRHALLYLSYTPIDKIPSTERVEFAYDVSMAALIGKDIFNFGELLERPLVKVLDDSKYSSTLKLLEAFHNGDIKTYEDIMAKDGKAQPLLQANKKFLSMKVRILRLMGTVFSRSSRDRALSFKEISDACDTKIDEVEFLVMKSFSLGVLKGIVDQVAQSVNIKWVQPRVLTKGQIKNMGDRLKVWTAELSKATAHVEEHSKEILQ
eukprot:jgi/Bigna1/51516/estExt_Genewise1Plus.C_10293